MELMYSMLFESPRRIALSLVLTSATLVIVGCAQTPPPSPTAVPDSSIGPASPPQVATTKAPEVAPPAATAVSSASAISPSASVQTPEPTPFGASRRMDAKTIATTAVLTPEGKSRYECSKGAKRDAIELPSNTLRICSRFPAMGPCQYERDACRAAGGRVIRFDGVEITKEVENEYDKQVQRFRLNAG
jgi:hypothetical protein